MMKRLAPALGITALLLQACASSTPTPEAPRANPASGRTEPANTDAAFAEAARGYTRVKKGDSLLYCRQERPSGSNIMTNVCLTEAQLREQVEAARRFQNDRSQQGRRCTSGPGCSN